MDNTYGKFRFSFRCVEVAVFLGIAILVGNLAFSLLGVSLLSGSNVSYFIKLIAFFSVGIFVSYSITFPFYRYVESNYIVPIYDVNKHKFEPVGQLQSKLENIVGLVSLISIIVISFIYSFYPHPLLLSLSLLFGALLAFIWLLHRERERKTVNKIYQKIIFVLSETVTLISIFLSYALCQFLLHMKFVDSLLLTPKVERAFLFFQLLEAILLGFILALLCEWLVKQFPVISK